MKNVDHVSATYVARNTPPNTKTYPIVIKSVVFIRFWKYAPIGFTKHMISICAGITYISFELTDFWSPRWWKYEMMYVLMFPHKYSFPTITSAHNPPKTVNIAYELLNPSFSSTDNNRGSVSVSWSNVKDWPFGVFIIIFKKIYFNLIINKNYI